MDLSHERFGLDHNRCILCTRCVRVCDEVEGAHTWDVAGRGAECLVISDLGEPWGDSDTCTGCGKCVQVCPTGALFLKGQDRRGNAQRPQLLAIHRDGAGEEGGSMKPRFATVWLGGCSGCHMSFLDLDERLIDLAGMVDLCSSPIADVKEFPENVDIALVEGAVANEDHLARDPAASASAARSWWRSEIAR